MRRGGLRPRTRSAKLLGLGALVSIALVTDCAELPVVASGTCGNHVVDTESGEDCDTYATEAGTACGAVGTPKQCRFECDARSDGTRPSCPLGSGCGTDGLCRAPSGSYAPRGAPFPADARALLAGDLDGDGRADVVTLGSHTAAAHYFDAEGALAATFDTPLAAHSGVYPILGDLSGDHRADLVYPEGLGSIVALGTPAQSLFPTAFPSLTLGKETTSLSAVGLEVLPDDPGDELVLLGTVSGISAFVYLKQGTINLLVLAFGSAADLAGEMPKGSINEDPVTSPCEELVAAFKGGAKAYMVTPCKPAAGGGYAWNQAPPREIVLPAGKQIERGPLLADANADGHLDLLMGVSGGEIDVSYGLGDGSFSSDPKNLAPGQNDDAFSKYPFTQGPLPLAMGDLNADGVLDWVAVDSVQMSVVHPDSSVTFTAAGLGDLTPWTEARIADLNGNGVPDVIAGSNANAGMIFFNGVGDGALNRFDIATNGPVAHFGVGDFDGDLVGDLAVSELAAGGDGVAQSLGDSVSVLFGRPTGAPEPPVSMGRLGTVTQLAPGHVLENGVVDGISDLVSISKSADEIFSFGGFNGRSDRLLRSPFLTSKQVMNSLGVFVPARFALGSFVGDAHPDVAMLTREGTGSAHRLWLVPSTGEARFDNVLSAPGDLLSPDVDWERALIAAEDVDGDGRDELLVLAPKVGDQGSSVGAVAHVALVDPAKPDGGSALVLGPLVPLDARFERVETEDAAPSPNGRVEVRDLDGDGRRDLVVLGSDAGSGGKRTATLAIFWNEGKGGLGAMVRAPVPASAALRDFAVVERDPRAAPSLALLTDVGVHSLELSGRTPTLVDAAPRVSFADGRLLAAGDLDGDGVQDLALMGPSGLSLFFGKPVLK